MAEGASGCSFVFIACVIVSWTGLYHGYDNGVTSDVFTMTSFRETMGWGPVGEQDPDVALQSFMIVSASNTGAAFSAVLSGHYLNDRYGRKPSLLIGSAIVAVGGLVQASSTGITQVIVGRIFAGIGEGITSSAGPSYIAEVAPEQMRGAMVGMYQSNVCLAIVAAAVLNNIVHGLDGGWRYSLGLQTVMGLVGIVGILFLGETPRFLQKAGRDEEARQIMTKLRGGDQEHAERELALVQKELAEEKATGEATWGEVCGNPYYRNVVIIGCLVQWFQIVTGINSIVSYGGVLFANLGLTSLLASLSPMIMFFVGNAIGAFYLADRIGRRPLLVWGMVAMAASLLTAGILGLVYSDTSTMPEFIGYAIIGMVIVFMFSFGISWGFGAWLYISEIMPLRVRGKAVGLATAVNWGPANLLSAYVTPVMIASQLGPGGTLVFFGCISLIAVPFARYFVPETKGRVLEEITPLFQFKGWDGLRSFMAGNVRGGFGAEGLQQSLTQTELS